ncbi:MAG: MlaD family protein [Candidatus Rokuibacteriota bacterium]
MTDSPEELDRDEALPTATVTRRRWTFAIVWVVPVVAAIVGGYLIVSRLQELGPTITIRFRDGSGVKAGQTELRYRGVPIGEVTAIELSRKREYVLVKTRLRRSAASLAREGSLFWIVRPEVGFGSVRGLSTVISGSYMQVLPGTGKAKSVFTGIERASPTLGQPGLKVTLSTVKLGSLRPGSPVHYRGIEVGSVTSTDLNSDATAAHVQIFIAQRYERLVRIGSRFWTASGVDVNLGLFRGLEINVESLRSLVAGGIAFATPDDPGAPPAKDGTLFLLHDKPQSEWLEWRPKISLAPAG